jgi:hypothetical protein
MAKVNQSNPIQTEPKTNDNPIKSTSNQSKPKIEDAPAVDFRNIVQDPKSAKAKEDPITERSKKREEEKIDISQIPYADEVPDLEEI